MSYVTRYLTSLAVLGIAITAGVAQAGTLNVQAGSAEAAAGGEVEVPIEVKGGKGVEGVQFVLSFDPTVLKHTTIDAGPLAGAGDVDSKVRESGKIRVALLPEKTLDGDGTLLVARFKVLGEAGSDSSIELTEARAWEFGSEAPLEMLVSTESGRVTVGSESLPIYLIAIIAGAVVLLLLLILVVRRGGGKTSTNT